METNIIQKEKITKKISDNKKNTIIKKRINLNSLDKFSKNQNPNIKKGVDMNKNEIIINLKNNEKGKIADNNAKFEQRKIILKLPSDMIHKRKVIDYIILNKKNSNNINKNENMESKGGDNAIDMYKENFENKSRLEELINDFALKKKMNNKNMNSNYNININQQNQNNNNNNNIIKKDNTQKNLLGKNIIKREMNNESKDKNKNLILKLNNNYYKKRPFYALDCKVYTKNKNIERSTPFKNKVIKNKMNAPKNIKISNNNFNNEVMVQNIKQRNSFRVKPINLTYNDVDNISTQNEKQNNISINSKDIYIKTGKNINESLNKDITDINYDNMVKEKIISDLNNNIEYNHEKIFINNDNREKIITDVETNTYKKLDILSQKYNTDSVNKNSRNTKTSNRKHRSFNKHSFKFLVHQTNRNRELSLSFSRRYKSKNNLISNNNNDALTNDSLSYSNLYNETETNYDPDSNKASIIYYSNIYNDKRYHLDNEKKNIKSENSYKTFRSIGNLMKSRTNSKMLTENSEDTRPYYNRIINDDYIEFTPISISNTKEETLKYKKENNDDNNSVNKYNKFNKNGVIFPKKFEIHSQLGSQEYKLIHSKINSSYDSFGLHNNLKSMYNLDQDNINNDNNKNTRNKSPVSQSSINTNFSFINLELLYFLEDKMKIILDKLKNYEKCAKECHQYINYYFIHNFYIEELRVFKINKNREFMINYLKMELLCYFLLYKISLGDKFKEAKILLKSIFELLYNNFLLFISFVIVQHENKDNNIIVMLNKIIKENLCDDYLKDINNLDENIYIEIILNNSKSINDYYKMIIDNLFIDFDQNNYIKLSDYISANPNEIDKNKLEIIITSFFIESYKSLLNFNFDIFHKFYYSFLCFNNSEDKNNNNIFNSMNILEEVTINYNTINSNKEDKDKEKKPLLPEIKDKQYSLILDLDETLIYAQRNFNYKLRKSENNINKKRIILRPCLHEFLHDMKDLFELIVFSSGTPDYVNPIIRIIEKNEKYFDYILYRHHITLDDDGNNVKNLDLLGRDLKNVIIVDDIPRYYHLQKENGINIKPFCGNILSDTKTLKTLNNVLKKIRIDVEESKDIRVSLEKYKYLLFPNVINKFE